MTAFGLKAQKTCGDPPRDTVYPPSRTSQWNVSSILIEWETDRPPRLCRKDLKDPEQFHQRLVEWLMKQR